MADWSASDLTAIRSAIAKGERMVQFADRSVTYRSIDELLKAEKVIAAALATEPKVFYIGVDQGFS